MTTIPKRLKGHLKWHLQRAQHRIRNARPDPETLKLRLRNKFWRGRVVSKGGPVVSLTSYGTRLETVFLAIESIGRGFTKPARLILWLDEEAAISNPPITLKRLMRRGLEIRSTANYLSHKKYLPYVLSCEIFAQPLATADDDVLYPKDWLQRLFTAFKENSSVINCFRARTISLRNGEMGPFNTWAFCSSTAPSFRNFSEGVGGVIFPPQYLVALKQAGLGFTQTCPRHDDVWLNVIAVRNGYRVRQVSSERISFPLIPYTQDDGLWVTNLGDDGDAQIRATYTKADIETMESELVNSSASQEHHHIHVENG